MTNQQTPGEVGQRLLPVTIDLLSKQQPDRAWASLPRDDTDLSKGFEDVTYTTLATAINRMASFIEKAVGKAEQDSVRCIAYIGTPDIRYHVMSMATAKTGNKVNVVLGNQQALLTVHQVLFSSHVHSPAQHVSLMTECGCTALFTSTRIQVEDILGQLPQLQHFVIPDMEEVFHSEPAPVYPFHKTIQEARNDVFLILHTSGSTGKPKPIPINHGAIAALDSFRTLPDYEGQPPKRRTRRFNWLHPGPTRLFCPFIPFHSVGAYASMVSSVFGGSTYIPGFRDRLTKPTDATQVIRYAKVDSAFVDPATVEELAKSPEAAELLAKMKVIIYAGGILSATIDA